MLNIVVADIFYNNNKKKKTWVKSAQTNIHIKFQTSVTDGFGKEAMWLGCSSFIVLNP